MNVLFIPDRLMNCTPEAHLLKENHQSKLIYFKKQLLDLPI